MLGRAALAPPISIALCACMAREAATVSPAVQAGVSVVLEQSEAPVPVPLPESKSEDPSCEEAPEAEVTLHVSADDSNSEADPVEVRQAIREGGPVTGPVRTWEFLNYYRFDHEPAPPDDLRIVPEVRTRADGGFSLLVAVVAPALSATQRRPLDVTFSIDSSGSMEGPPLQRAKEAVRAVAAELRSGDTVSVVSWAEESSLLLSMEEVDGPEDPEVLDAVADLVAGGSTDLERGLRTAYAQAAVAAGPGRTNRVILVSDGGANTGETDERLIADHAEDSEADGIYLVGVGTGWSGRYDDRLMDTVTDLGKGAYLYVDTEDEARAAFSGERFLAHLEIAARNVRLAITLPPRWLVAEFHGEEASEDPEEVAPQHLAPNDSMLYHFELRDCASGAREDEEFGFRVAWEDPETREPREREVSMSLDEMLARDGRNPWKADAIVAYAAAVGAPRDDPDAEERIGRARDEVEAAIAGIGPDPDLMEIRDLLDQYLRAF